MMALKECRTSTLRNGTLRQEVFRYGRRKVVVTSTPKTSAGTRFRFSVALFHCENNLIADEVGDTNRYETALDLAATLLGVKR